MEEELIRIQKELKAEISDSKKLNEEAHDASWDCQTGILITRNQAETILNILDRSLGVKDDNKLLDQSVMLEWIRQWTNLYDKGKELAFKGILQEFVFEYMTDKLK